MPKLPTGQKPLVSRNVKADLDKWDRAMKIADERGETISDVVRRAVAAYVKRYEQSGDAS